MSKTNIIIEKTDIKKIISSNDKLNKQLNGILLLGDSAQSDYLYKTYSEMVQDSINTTNSLIRLSDKANLYYDNNPIINITPSLKMSYEDNIYHYILDELLPHRRNIRTKKEETNYNKLKGYLSLGYKSGVEEYLKNHEVIHFEGKILVCFINHCTSNSHDLDNLDQKPFIDIAVNKVITKDDNYSHISHLMIGVQSENEYTEVFAGKSVDVFNKLKSLNIEL